jgi:hypothetical protein
VVRGARGSRATRQARPQPGLLRLLARRPMADHAEARRRPHDLRRQNLHLSQALSRNQAARLASARRPSPRRPSACRAKPR